MHSLYQGRSNLILSSLTCLYPTDPPHGHDFFIRGGARKLDPHEKLLANGEGLGDAKEHAPQADVQDLNGFLMQSPWDGAVAKPVHRVTLFQAQFVFHV